MKKVLKFLATISPVLALLVAGTAFAIEVPPVEGISQETDVVNVVFNVINWILIVTGAAAVLMLIIGGFRYITSAGNEGQVEAAKNTMTAAIIGLVIVLLAFVIAATINNIILNPTA